MNLESTWEEKTMGEIGTYLNGRAFKSSEWSTKGRPIIRIQNLTGSGSDYNYFDGELAERYIVRPGDLLFSWSATLGTYIWKGPEAALNQHIFKVESKIDKKFHKYLLDFKIQEMHDQTHGSGMVHITKKLFDAIPVLIPPLSKQIEIVQMLDDQLSRINATKKIAEEVSILSKKFEKSLLHHAFTGKVGEKQDE